MNIDTPHRIRPFAELAVALFDQAEKGARSAALKIKRARLLGRRPRGGRTLRPGPLTPLWNEMIKQARPFLRTRGSKVRLARFLGVPRQRLQDCLKSRIATLDAERTLLFLAWISARQQGRDIHV